MSAAIDDHWLYIGDQPHLYPLARIESLHPACAIVLADTNAARIMVFAAGEVVSQEEVTGVKTRRTSQGGWSQARYQRHIENFHLQHIKEVVEALEKIVQRENIPEIVVAGDEVVLPLLREQMPKHLQQQKVVDHVRMNINSPLEQLIGSSLDALRRARTEDEREKVDAAVGGFRSGGLGVIGPEDTLGALVKGQVDELLISSQLVRCNRSVPRRGRRPPTASERCCQNRCWNRSPQETSRGRCGDGSPRRRARDQGDADLGEDHVHRRRGAARRHMAAWPRF